MRRTIITLIAIILTLALVSCGASDTATGPAPTATVDPTSTPAYQLASLDEQGATPSAATIAQYQKVLDSLHDKTGETEPGIAAGTITAQGILTQDKYSGDHRLITLLNGVDGAITKKEHQKFAESMAALITIMENGK